MLMHPGMERLQAFSAGELSGEPRRRTADHLAQCPRCRTTIEWLDDVRFVAREDVPEPAADVWSKIAARVAAKDAVLLPTEGVAPVSAGRVTSRALRVAILTLLLGGAAAAAIPGTWVRDVIESILPGKGPVLPAPPVEVAEQPAAATPPVILVVEPAAGAVHITLERPDAAVRIHVQLVDASEFEVRAQDGAAAATFRSSPGRLDIVEAGSGAVMLAVPRSLGRVRIDVDGRTFLIKERGQVRVLAPTADTIGTEYILPVRGAASPSNSQ